MVLGSDGEIFPVDMAFFFLDNTIIWDTIKNLIGKLFGLFGNFVLMNTDRPASVAGLHIWDLNGTQKESKQNCSVILASKRLTPRLRKVQPGIVIP